MKHFVIELILNEPLRGSVVPKIILSSQEKIGFNFTFESRVY